MIKIKLSPMQQEYYKAMGKYKIIMLKSKRPLPFSYMIEISERLLKIEVDN